MKNYFIKINKVNNPFFYNLNTFCKEFWSQESFQNFFYSENPRYIQWIG